jgi:hypothetical protein
MAGMKELMQEYERARFSEDRRLDLHAEGPRAATERALQWIQSRAHETPGQELLLIVERPFRGDRPPSPVRAAVQTLLTELQGKLIDWWQPSAPGSIALRISREPSMRTRRVAAPLADTDEGRTSATAGFVRLPARDDIPSELLAEAERIVDLRIEREGLSDRIRDVLLREVWIEVQAAAMEFGTSFATALGAVRSNEIARIDFD